MIIITKENNIEKSVNINSGDNNWKNLYENVGKGVSRLIEINSTYDQEK